MRQITTTVYKLDEHPNPSKCYEWIRNNWHDLGDHVINDVIGSLKALACVVEGSLDYSVSAVPDRGEYVKLANYNQQLLEDFVSKGNCDSLTGTTYDEDVTMGLYNHRLESTVLKCIHDEVEYTYSDEGLAELCEANEYEFTIEGKWYG